ncbi:ABC transporter ATP-binding protein [Marinobacterium aestuariivivens]|uniref:ABC transporter ATP-binding protein n=1 Tax=Marinobacterium aestuariivivens TaxID=1698799 RepID=A0ABW1ZXH1_9GAMM
MNSLPSALEFRGVTKGFRLPNSTDTRIAINDVNFNVRNGEFVAIVGPSGCGKSTILNMTAGLYQPTAGEVYVSGEQVTSPNSHVGFMLQKDLLLPWRTIVGNVEFGLEARGMGKADRREVALSELKRCHLEDFANHYPYQLSGGMRQRAALARTLAIDPAIVLLDEPFSALDAQTKLLLQQNFGETIMQSGVTTLLITHDLSEAVFMADRILVLSERPATVIEEIVVDLPTRGNLMERRKSPKASEYIGRLFELLKLESRAI